MYINLILPYKSYIHVHVHFLVYLNKNFKNYWSEPSFTDSGLEDGCSLWELIYSKQWSQCIETLVCFYSLFYKVENVSLSNAFPHLQIVNTPRVFIRRNVVGTCSTTDRSDRQNFLFDYFQLLPVGKDYRTGIWH